MLHPFAALLGIVCAVLAILVMLRAFTLKHLVQVVQRGIMAIFAFIVLGIVVQMLLPGLLTGGFVCAAWFSLLLGVSVAVLALALILIAKYFFSAGNDRGSK